MFSEFIMCNLALEHGDYRMKCGSDEGLNFVTGDKTIDSLLVEITDNGISKWVLGHFCNDLCSRAVLSKKFGADYEQLLRPIFLIIHGQKINLEFF